MKYLISTMVLLFAAPAATSQSGGSKSLAESLPADTLFYIEISDIPGLQNGLNEAALGQIFRDAKVQDFIGNLVQMGQAQWTAGLAMVAEQGMPTQFLSWDAFQSLSLGIAMRPGQVGEPPMLMVAAEIAFNQGFGAQAFEIISAAIGLGRSGEIVETEGQKLIHIVNGANEPEIEVLLNGDRLRFVGLLNFDLETDSTLASSVAYKRSRKQLSKPGMLIHGFYNPQAALSLQRTYLELGAQQAEIASLALAVSSFSEKAVGNAQAVSFAGGWDPATKESLTTAYVDFGGKEPGWAYSKGEVDHNLVGYIPHNADAFSFASLAGAGGVNEVLIGIDEVLADESMQQNIAIWADAEPVSYSWILGENRPLLDAALRSFGKRAFSYSVPSFGSRSLIEITDPVALQAAATPLVRTIAKALDSIPEIPVALRAKRESRRDQPGESIPIYYLRLRKEALPPEFAQLSMFIGEIEPAFAISPDGWLVASGSRANVRQIIRSGLKEAGRNILENPEAKDFLGRIPSGAMAVSWADPRPGVTSGFTMLQAASGMIPMVLGDQADQIPVDFAKMPAATSITDYLKPSETVSWLDEDGIKSISRGSVGMADVAALMGYCTPIIAGTALFISGSESQMPVAPDFPDDLLIEEDPRSATIHELARLRTGLDLYQFMNGKLPESLDQLTQKGPEGQDYLESPEHGLMADGWGNAFLYKVTDGSINLYSCGPDGADNGGQGDDVSLK
jgi:type II secretion system (T2SS) protein G